MQPWFVDTAYAVALANESDELHDRALALESHIMRDAIALLTTEAVLIEIASALRFPRLRHSAVEIIEGLWRSAVIVQLSPDLLRESWEMYKRHSDKEWSWVDTISFVVMRREGMTEALTSDHHFTQAGFRALLAPDEIS